MPFLQSDHHKIKNSTAHSLRAYLGTCQGSHQILSYLSGLFRTVSRLLRRASLFIAHSKARASMTLEAAFVLPFFMFAVINMVFLINIIGTQSRFSAALHQTGNKMAFAAHIYEKSIGTALPEELVGVVMSELYAKNQVTKYVGHDYLEKSYVVNGQRGVAMRGTSVMGAGDIIDLRISYKVHPFSSIMGFEEFSMSQRYYGKAWTGYDVEGQVSDSNTEDPMVYITKTGTVYHLARSCTYLNPSVEAVDVNSVADRRNQSGGKYYACGRCGKQTSQGTVYITSQGSSFHSDINCSGLKRTIYTVPLSQVGGRGRCLKCG